MFCWLPGTHRRSLIFQLFITVTEIEHHISYLTLTEHYRWPDFSCINCWFNTGCPERQFAPPNLAAVGDNVYIHLCCGAFIDWFLPTYSVTSAGFLRGVIQNSTLCRQAFLPFFLTPLRASTQATWHVDGITQWSLTSHTLVCCAS